MAAVAAAPLQNFSEGAEATDTSQVLQLGAQGFDPPDQARAESLVKHFCVLFSFVCTVDFSPVDLQEFEVAEDVDVDGLFDPAGHDLQSDSLLEEVIQELEIEEGVVGGGDDMEGFLSFRSE